MSDWYAEAQEFKRRRAVELFKHEEEAILASRENAGLDIPKARQDAGFNKSGNGAQQGFTTGATRSTDAGKIDFEGHFNPEVLAIFGDYMNRHKVQRDGKLRASDNWQEGIPVYRYVKSLVRHTFEFWRMWRGTEVINPDSGKLFTFQDVLCAIMFNVMGILYELRTQSFGTTGKVLDNTCLLKTQRKFLENEDQPKQEQVIPKGEPGPVYLYSYSSPVPNRNPATLPGGCDTAGRSTREEQ